MREFLDNGARLGWLIDPQQRKVHVYRTDAEIDVLDEPSSIAGNPELPGLVLDLTRIWDPGW